MICKICDVPCFNPTIEVLFCGGATQSVVKKDFAQGWAASATRCDHDIFYYLLLSPCDGKIFYWFFFG
jgi:hypothetical protein